MLNRDIYFEIATYLTISDLRRYMLADKFIYNSCIKLYEQRRKERYNYITALMDKFRIILPERPFRHIIKLYDNGDIQLVNDTLSNRTIQSWLDFSGNIFGDVVKDIYAHLDTINTMDEYIELLTNETRYYYNNNGKLSSIVLSYNCYVSDYAEFKSSDENHILESGESYYEYHPFFSVDFELYSYFTDYISEADANDTYLRGIGIDPIAYNPKEILYKDL